MRRLSRLGLHLLPPMMQMTGAVLILVLIGPATTLRNVAGSHPRPGSQIFTETSARALLQTDASRSPSPSSEGPPLPTPADALTVCSTDVLREATRCKDRKHVWFEEGGAEAGEQLGQACARMGTSPCTHLPTAVPSLCALLIISSLVHRQYHDWCDLVTSAGACVQRRSAAS